MRTDGTYKLYKIQHRQESDRRWVFSSFDFFGTPAGFTASSECWQVTGEYGTFGAIIARKGVVWMREHHPTRIFRVVKIITAQRTLSMCW